MIPEREDVDVMTTLLDAIIDRLIATGDVTVHVLEEPYEPCQHPEYTGACAAYCAGCRCPRCRGAWRSYRRGYESGVRWPMGRLDGRPR